MQLQYVSTADKASIPLYWFCADQTRATVLLQPALGIQAKLYLQLAEGLAQRGYATAILEQRGHGLSSFSPGYSSSYSFCETLDHDLPAALNWIAEEVPAVPRILGGHSLGGHLSTIYTGMHPADIQAVIHLACAFPYIADYPPPQRRSLRMLTALIPFFQLVPGYYPGHLLGFGERESLAMMKQWRQWATSGSFDFDDRTGLAEAVAAFGGPLLSLSFERDPFSTEKAVDRALSPFTGARIQRQVLGPDSQGDYLGHTAWAKRPQGVVQVISDWLDEQLIS